MEKSLILSARFPGCPLDDGSLLVSSNNVWSSYFIFIFRQFIFQYGTLSGTHFPRKEVSQYG